MPQQSDVLFARMLNERMHRGILGPTEGTIFEARLVGPENPWPDYGIAATKLIAPTEIPKVPMPNSSANLQVRFTSLKLWMRSAHVKVQVNKQQRRDCNAWIEQRSLCNTSRYLHSVFLYGGTHTCNIMSVM